MTRSEATRRIVGALDLLNHLCIRDGLLFDDAEFVRATFLDAQALTVLGLTEQELDSLD